jgi:hypothetical protein
VTRSSRLAVETRYICWGAGMSISTTTDTRSFYGEGKRLSRGRAEITAICQQTPRAVFRNHSNGTFEELDEQAGPGITRRHCKPRLRFGDFDNDGDRMSDFEFERTPISAAERICGAADWPRSSWRRQVESQCDRGTRAGALWREGSGASGTQPIEFLLLQRCPAALRPGDIWFGRHRSLMAEWPPRTIQDVRPINCDSARRSGNRSSKGWTKG